MNTLLIKQVRNRWRVNHLAPLVVPRPFNQITYPGTNNFSQLSYDGIGRNNQIVETVSGSVTSARQFVWCDGTRCEERDGTGTLTKQFFSGGQRNSTTNYFYTMDHLGSVRELTDGSGVVQAQYSFDPYGRATKLLGSQSSEFQYAGYYMHSPSGLNLTQYRAYSGTLGRWISREPEEDEEANLYQYVHNNPANLVDLDGLAAGLPIIPFQAPTPPGNTTPVTTTPQTDPKHRRQPPGPQRPNRGGVPGRHKPTPPRPPNRKDRRCKRKCRAPNPGTPQAISQGLVDRLHCWQWCEKNCPPVEIYPCLTDCEKYPRDDKTYPNPPPPSR